MAAHVSPGLTFTCSVFTGRLKDQCLKLWSVIRWLFSDEAASLCVEWNEFCCCSTSFFLNLYFCTQTLRCKYKLSDCRCLAVLHSNINKVWIWTSDSSCHFKNIYFHTTFNTLKLLLRNVIFVIYRTEHIVPLYGSKEMSNLFFAKGSGGLTK